MPATDSSDFSQERYNEHVFGITNAAIRRLESIWWNGRRHNKIFVNRLIRKADQGSRDTQRQCLARNSRRGRASGRCQARGAHCKNETPQIVGGGQLAGECGAHPALTVHPLQDLHRPAR